jgi:hypothetical protein
MAQALTKWAFRDSRDSSARDETAIRTMEGIVNGTFYSLALFWIPIFLALSQCAHG